MERYLINPKGYQIMRLFVLTMVGIGLMSGAALADGDAVKGEKTFKKCMACHTIADKANKVGPHLVGLVGRAVASVEGYTYSDSMKKYAATGAVWDEAALQAYLENPKAIVAKSKMAFPGIKKEDERQDLIAFLKTKGEAVLSPTNELSTARTDSAPASSGLVLPKMDPKRGRELFVSKGCVVCHAVNGVGGGYAAPLDASTMDPAMNPFEFFARMWQGTKPMIAMQEEKMEQQVELTAEELGDIVAFVYDGTMQKSFSKTEIPKNIERLME
ncbi:MAG: c-type cytochrome [Aestuariivirga sp.]